MGNIFSKKLSAREQLFLLENEVTELEDAIKQLRKNKTGLTGWIFAFCITGIAAIFLNLWQSTFNGVLLVVLGLAFVWLLTTGWRAWSLRRADSRLSVLRSKIRSLVELFRNDPSFVRAKTLIEKYEDAECRDSFFKRIQKKRRDSVEKLAEYVLGSDPSQMHALICVKCGMHNGLIDPGNKDFPWYYCYNCHTRNIRASKTE